MPNAHNQSIGSKLKLEMWRISIYRFQYLGQNVFKPRSF